MSFSGLRATLRKKKHLWLYLKCDENENKFEPIRASCRVCETPQSRQFSSLASYQRHWWSIVKVLSGTLQKCKRTVCDKKNKCERNCFIFFIAFHVHKKKDFYFISGMRCCHKSTRSCDVDSRWRKISVWMVIISHRRLGTSCSSSFHCCRLIT